MSQTDRNMALPGCGISPEDYAHIVHAVVRTLTAQMKPKGIARAKGTLKAWAQRLERENDWPPNVTPLHGPRPGIEERSHVAGRLARAAVIRRLLEESID